VNKAEITVLPNRFKIDGPPALVAMTQAIVGNKTLSAAEVQHFLNDLWTVWYVECSVSGELIPLTDLRYWNVTTQEVFARPALIPDLQG
jgi:hypothetical protein